MRRTTLGRSDSEPLERPGLGIVIATRNDDHGGQLIQRTQLFIDSLTYQVSQTQTSVELVIVEWNPPEQTPPLASVLKARVGSGNLNIRVITVPPSIHSSFGGNKIPLYQMIAKNVGIRRSRAHHILATNPDVLFSDSLIRFATSGRIHRELYYRVDRYDVSLEDAEEAVRANEVDDLAAKATLINKRAGSFDRPSHTTHRIYPRYFPILLAFDKLEVLPWGSPIKERFLNSSRWLATRRVPLHTGASGDFILMASENWHRLRGFLELPDHGVHVDSLLCYAAHHSGIRERVLRGRKRIFHMEHHRRWLAHGASEETRDESISLMTNSRLNEWALAMRRGHFPTLNSPGWGLDDTILEETALDSRAQ